MRRTIYPHGMTRRGLLRASAAAAATAAMVGPARAQAGSITFLTYGGNLRR